MTNQLKKTPLFLVCLLSSVVALTACSYSTEFVVINAANNPIEVRYRLKKPMNSLAPVRLPEVPSVKLIAELDQQIPWRPLPTSRFTFDPESRMAVVSLMPGESLRVEQRKLSEGPQDDAHQAANFSIEEINITGANGEVMFQGEQARKSFVPVSKTLYTLTYR
jgi:hypothetical protein